MLSYFMKLLIRCAGSSLTTVLFEFVLLTVLVSQVHLRYLLAAPIVGVVGLFFCFLLNRRWAFGRCRASPWPQLLRHALVVGGGMALATALLWLQVDRLGLPYQLGWATGGAVTFFGWTFPMQRWFTFRPAAATEGE
jgi:putative flippase GtrA